MRIVVTYENDQIVQVEKNPPLGSPIVRTGMYMVPVAEGVRITVGPGSFVLPSVNPNSVVAQNFAGLLAQFPQYENILYNPLIEGTDIGNLDPVGVLNEGSPVSASYASRFQIGRAPGGPLPAGNAANSVAVLPNNDSAGIGFERPGVLVSDTIDIGPVTGGMGATEFAVYWYLYEFDTTEDVRSSFGLFAGQNTPALREVTEIDQEVSDLEVFLSANDGANYTLIQRLMPISYCNPVNLMRIAFKNNNPLRKRYVAHYALLF